MTVQARARLAADTLESDRIARLNAVVSYDRAALMHQAAEVAQRADPGPLAGLTVAVKDNICTLTYPTTCASHILAGYRSPFEATAVTRLRAAGALVACTTNMDEFGMGSSTEHSVYGRCLHPTHLDRVPGGSSGGSAALVAAGAVDVALGSETGGSVRQPAAFCGVVGFKPSYGRVSRWGLVAFGSSLDQIGVFGADVASVARVVDAMSGYDPLDSTSWPEPALRSASGVPSLAGEVIGVPEEFVPRSLDAGVRRAFERTVDLASAAGASIRSVRLPHTPVAPATYYIVATAEASSNLSRFDGVRYGRRGQPPGQAVPDEGALRTLYRTTRGTGFGPEVKRRILVGTYVLSAGYYDAYYRKAQLVRGRVADDFRRVFDEGVQALLAPTTPGPAFRAGERLRDPVAMYGSDRFTVSANLAGLPALSLPIGRRDGLPLGAQLMGPAGRDEHVIQLAAALEATVDGEAEVT